MMDPDPRQYDHITINETDIHNIVLSYLVHNCFKETAESFITCSGMKHSADHLMNMGPRKSIFTLASEGNALKAIELTRESAPMLLEENKDLYFDLLSLHFVSLVRSRKCTEALEFAQTMLTPFGKIPKYVEKLEDFMALLAYEEPEKSPMFHLLSQEYRENVASSLNRAILAHFNLPAFSSMERLIQQATVVRLYLNKEPGKVESMVYFHNTWFFKIFSIWEGIIGTQLFLLSASGCWCFWEENVRVPIQNPSTCSQVYCNDFVKGNRGIDCP